MNKAHGFTLIEVLVALAVLALSLTASLTASTFYAGTTRDLEDRMLASWLAHNVMVETQLETQWPATGKSNNTREFAAQEWVVEREVQETPDDYIRRITVRVRRESADDDAWLLSRAAFFAEPAGPAPVVPASNNPNPGGTGVSGNNPQDNGDNGKEP